MVALCTMHLHAGSSRFSTLFSLLRLQKGKWKMFSMIRELSVIIELLLYYLLFEQSPLHFLQALQPTNSYFLQMHLCVLQSGAHPRRSTVAQNAEKWPKIEILCFRWELCSITLNQTRRQFFAKVLLTNPRGNLL